MALTWLSGVCYDLRVSCGGVAQLGERGVRNAEVDGSIPFTSTISPPAHLHE